MVMVMEILSEKDDLGMYFFVDLSFTVVSFFHKIPILYFYNKKEKFSG